MRRLKDHVMPTLPPIKIKFEDSMNKLLKEIYGFTIALIVVSIGRNVLTGDVSKVTAFSITKEIK